MWTQVLCSWILNSVSSKESESFAVHWKPFVPSCTPSIVVNEHLVTSDVNYLCLQPLINRILCINPLAKDPLRSLALIKCLKRLIFSREICLILLNVSHLKKMLECSDTLEQGFATFSLVHMHGGQVLSRVLLKNQSSIPPHEIRFIFKRAMIIKARCNLLIVRAISETRSMPPELAIANVGFVALD